MILTNANIFDSTKGFGLGTVITNGEKIQKVIFDDCSTYKDYIDCEGKYLLPGFIDIHFHGCNGYDFCDASKQSLDAITEYELKNGITSICPATMTYSEEILTPIMKNVAQYNNHRGSEIIGINMEGPFISVDRIGAQNPNYVQTPDVAMIERLDKVSNGLIKLIDIAPEVNEATEFIKKLHSQYSISIAHTCCTYDVAKEAFQLGANHLTHTYNAMPPIHHRNPGPILAAMENNAYAEIICDGMHIHYAAVRLAFNMFKNSICLISDSCEATGLDDGQYSLGGQAIIKKGNRVVLKDHQNTIAASATNLFDCFRHAVLDAGIPIENAVNAASLNPARSIKMDNMYGSISVGKYANMILLDKKLNLNNVILKGNFIDL